MDISRKFFTFFTFIIVIINAIGAIPGCEFTSTRLMCQGPNITSFPETILATITEVHVKHANMETLNTTALKQTKQLHELLVEDSGVSDFVDSDFSELKYLKAISLKGNKLTTLPEGIFSNLSFLKQMRLSENQLVSIEGAFKGLGSLEILSLNDNQISEITINTFKDLTSLHHLELNNNKITKIQPNAFGNMKALMLVGLGSNPITSVANIFPKDMMLQYLNMTACNLTNFPNDLPASLKYLKLTKNKISRISKSDTQLYVHLNALILEENTLSYVEPGTFSQMTALIDIFLFVNNLQKFPGPFPASIKNVYLDNNQISSFPPGMFQNGTTLDILSLRINNITSLSANAFQNVDSIRQLHLERNPFSVLQDDTFKLAKGLEYLNLNRLTLAAVYPDCFFNLTSLTKLEMSFVHVSKDQVHGNIFRNLPRLEELKLQDSPTLAEVFLTNLIIEHKKIKTITKLNLEDNGLESLSSDIQSYLPNLRELSLRGNNFQCNANLVWLRNWHSAEPHKFHKFEQVRCHSPRHLQGLKIQDVTDKQFFDQTGSWNDSQDQDVNTQFYYVSHTTPVYIYDYEDIYPYDYEELSTVESKGFQNHLTPFWTASTSLPVPDNDLNQNNNQQDNGNDYDVADDVADDAAAGANDDDNKDSNISVVNKNPKQKKHGNASSLKTVGIAFGMAFGVIVVMLLIAFVVYKVWQRKRNARLENRRHQNGGQDYVFISTHTERQDRPEPKVHRKMSRAERGSTTSRASEDITNHTDTNMKVYTLDVDA